MPRVKYCRDTGEASDAVGAWLYNRLRLRTAPAVPESVGGGFDPAKWVVPGGGDDMHVFWALGGIADAARICHLADFRLGHWYTEIWGTAEKQWHAVDNASRDRTYHTSWTLRVRKSTILSTTGERGGWNALNEQRWEAFTNTVGLFYPSGQVVVRVLDRDQPVKGQRVVTQSWFKNERVLRPGRANG